MRREFGTRPALLATTMLGSSAAWLAYSHVAVTDLPLSVTFSAAMLLGLRLVGQPDPGQRAPTRGSPASSEPRLLRSGQAAALGALLALAVLAKGLVPLVLALPLLWSARRRLRELLHPAALAAFALVAGPWYLLCWRANGWRFIEEFFLRHHFGRFASEALQHPQPWWFYVPVLLAALFPWTPLLILLPSKRIWTDPRRRFLLLWVAFGLVFFSMAVNKLPGYLLPLMPALCALLGLEAAESRPLRWLLACCALLVALVPVGAALLPEALLEGLRRAETAGIRWEASAPALAVAALAWRLESRGRRMAAVGSVLAVMIAAVVWLKLAALPAVDRVASARALYNANRALLPALCVEQASRGWLYGLYYYAGMRLPACGEQPRPWRLTQSAVGARLERAY